MLRVLLLTALAASSIGAVACSTGTGPGPSDGGEGEGEGEGDAGVDAGTSSCTVQPGAWVGTDRDTNAVAALGLRAQLDTLIGNDVMRGAEAGVDGGAPLVVDLADLTAAYEAGDPSLKGATTTAFDAIVQDAFAEFLEVLAAGNQDLVDGTGAWTPGTAGGIYGSTSRGLNEGGLELRQVLDKGLYAGGAFYNYGLELTAGTITAATIDQLSALWGGNATLDPTGTKTDAASYTFQMGYHDDVVDALADARAYVADADCTAERDAAIVRFFRAWEKAMYARLVFYVHEAALGVPAATGDDDYAAVLHELTEGTALAMGFYGLPNPAAGPLAGAARVVTDAQITSIMTELGVNLADLGASTTGDKVIELNLDATIANVETTLETALGVQAAEVDGWASPVAG